jgi:hypothetical protein
MLDLGDLLSSINITKSKDFHIADFDCSNDGYGWWIKVSAGETGVM